MTCITNFIQRFIFVQIGVGYRDHIFPQSQWAPLIFLATVPMTVLIHSIISALNFSGITIWSYQTVICCVGILFWSGNQVLKFFYNTVLLSAIHYVSLRFVPCLIEFLVPSNVFSFTTSIHLRHRRSWGDLIYTQIHINPNMHW